MQSRARWSISAGVTLLALLYAHDAAVWGAPATSKTKPGVKAKTGAPKAAVGITLEYAAEQLEELLSGVTEISTVGVPGPLCISRSALIPGRRRSERRLPYADRRGR